MRPPLHPDGLTRHSSGLSEPHKQLIRLLAEKAVTDFLNETEPADLAQDAPEVTP